MTGIEGGQPEATQPEALEHPQEPGVSAGPDPTAEGGSEQAVPLSIKAEVDVASTAPAEEDTQEVIAQDSTKPDSSNTSAGAADDEPCTTANEQQVKTLGCITDLHGGEPAFLEKVESLKQSFTDTRGKHTRASKRQKVLPPDIKKDDSVTVDGETAKPESEVAEPQLPAKPSRGARRKAQKAEAGSKRKASNASETHRPCTWPAQRLQSKQCLRRAFRDLIHANAAEADLGDHETAVKQENGTGAAPEVAQPTSTEPLDTGMVGAQSGGSLTARSPAAQPAAQHPGAFCRHLTRLHAISAIQALTCVEERTRGGHARALQHVLRQD